MPKISKDKEEKNNIVSSKKTPIKKQTSVEKNIKKGLEYYLNDEPFSIFFQKLFLIQQKKKKSLPLPKM